MTATDDVLDLVRRWAAGEAANDASALEDVLDPDFVGVGPVGFVLDRTQWLVRFGNGLTNRAFAVEEPRVRGFGDTAVVIGTLAQETSFHGQDNSGRFRITLVAVRGDGGWRLANAHIGHLQGGPAGPPPGAPGPSA